MSIKPITMSLLKKLFCSHKWQTHAKQKYTRTTKEVVEGSEYWYQPMVQNKVTDTTNEILICTECGKIKKIEY